MYKLIQLLAFLLPFQLAYHVNSLQTTIYGFRIDYLIPTIYLTDIVVMAIIILGIRKIKFSRKFLIFSLLYIIFAAVNILISSYLVPSAYRWLKVTEMLLLGIIIINTKRFEVFKHFVKPLSYSVFVVSLLGIWQFLTKGSVGGLFYWLGERRFLFSDPNIAPYPYSTFSHPNSFAGFLLVFGIFLLQYKKKFSVKYFWILLTLVAINLILTNSLNVDITVLFLLLLKFRKNTAFGFLTFDFSQRFISHRLELIKSSLQLIKENFWTGVGLNNFIPNLVKVSNSYLNVWELQPVHNIFLLVFSEVGVVGFIAFCLLVFSSLSPVTYLAGASSAYSLLAIVATGLSDHYWLTLQQNMLLFTFVVAISKKQ